LFQNSKASYIRTRDAEETAQVAHVDSPCSSSFTNHSQLPSQVTDAGSPISTQTSEYEDVESGTAVFSSYSVTHHATASIVSLIHISIMHPSSVSKAKFDAADNYQANSRYHSFAEMQQYGGGPVADNRLLNSYASIPLPNDQCEKQLLAFKFI